MHGVGRLPLQAASQCMLARGFAGEVAGHKHRCVSYFLVGKDVLTVDAAASTRLARAPLPCSGQALLPADFVLCLHHWGLSDVMGVACAPPLASVWLPGGATSTSTLPSSVSRSAERSLAMQCMASISLVAALALAADRTTCTYRRGQLMGL